MTKLFIVVAILIAGGLIIMKYRRSHDLEQLLLSGLLLGVVISLGIVGNMMRSITPLFLTHLVALSAGYLGVLLYILRERFYWYLSLAPVATLLFYLLLSWLGNEHI